MKVTYKKADDVQVNGTSVFRGIGYGLLLTAVATGVGWGGYDLLWAVKGNSVQRDSAINRESLGFQQAHVDEINLKLADVANLDSVIAETTDPAQLAADNSQKAAIVAIVCADWHQLTPAYKGALDNDQQIEVSKLCAPPAQP